MLRLVYYTDIHSRVEWDTPEALELTADRINALKPDLVLCGGDCITDGFQASPQSVEPRWDAYMRLHRGIQAPVQAVIGNHDLCGARPEDGTAPVADPRRVFREKMNLASTYRSFSFAGYHFMLLDSLEVLTEDQPYRGYIDPVQQEWIIRDLEKLPAGTPIIVMSHMPLLSTYYQAVYSATKPMPNNRIVENSKEVLKLFRGYNLLAVLQGHIHVDERITWKGTQFITGGAVCGKWWRGPWHGTEEGFGFIMLNGNRLAYDYRALPWESRRPANQ